MPYLRANGRSVRFLTISLDKYGVQYNQDKRAGVFVKRKQERLAAEIVAAAAAEDAKALLLAEEENQSIMALLVAAFCCCNKSRDGAAGEVDVMIRMLLLL